MKISSRGRNALLLMLDLAQNGTVNYVPLKDVAERQGVSVKYLEQIMSLLSKFGLVQSVRGPSGGYKLLRPVSSITVGEVLRVTEGSFNITTDFESLSTNNDKKISISLDKFCGDLSKVVNEFMDSVTLDKLIFETGVYEYVI